MKLQADDVKPWVADATTNLGEARCEIQSDLKVMAGVELLDCNDTGRASWAGSPVGNHMIEAECQL